MIEQKHYGSEWKCWNTSCFLRQKHSIFWVYVGQSHPSRALHMRANGESNLCVERKPFRKSKHVVNMSQIRLPFSYSSCAMWYKRFVHRIVDFLQTVFNQQNSTVHQSPRFLNVDILVLWFLFRIHAVLYLFYAFIIAVDNF